MGLFYFYYEDCAMWTVDDGNVSIPVDGAFLFLLCLCHRFFSLLNAIIQSFAAVCTSLANPDQVNDKRRIFGSFFGRIGRTKALTSPLDLSLALATGVCERLALSIALVCPSGLHITSCSSPQAQDGSIVNDLDEMCARRGGYGSKQPGKLYRRVPR